MERTKITIQHVTGTISVNIDKDKVREFIENLAQCSNGELRYLEYVDDAGKVYVFMPEFLNNSLISYND